jgi:hypothetical protein
VCATPIRSSVVSARLPRALSLSLWTLLTELPRRRGAGIPGVLKHELAC